MTALEKEIADDPYVIDNELNAEIPTNNYMNSVNLILNSRHSWINKDDLLSDL